jgi:hypothetical protein
MPHYDQGQALNMVVLLEQEPEAFDPDPYLELMDRHGIHHAVEERTPAVAG